MAKKTDNEKNPSTKKTAEVDLFGQADASAPVATKKAKGKLKKVVEWASEFEVYTALCIFFNALKGTKAALEKEYKDMAFELFYKDIMSSGVKPDSFEATAGSACANLQYKKKSHSFSPEMADQLTELGVPFETKEVVPEGYIINPEITNNPVLRTKMNEALKTVNFGVQTFIKQNAVQKFYMNDATIPAIVEKVKSEEDRKTLLRDIATLALAQPSLDGMMLSSKEDAEDANELVVTKALSLLQKNGIVALAKKKKVLNKKTSDGSDDE